MKMHSIRFLSAILFASQINRREILSAIITSSIVANDEKVFIQDDDFEEEFKHWSVTFPLEPSSGGTNSIRATISYKPVQTRFGSKTFIPKRIFKVIVDTGSPYLVIADGMEFTSFYEELIAEEHGGLFSLFDTILLFLGEDFPYLLDESSYAPTTEIYGSQEGNIEWKEAFIQLRDNRLSKNTVFGVLDDKLTKEAGGALLGLVKRSNPESEKVQLRPTFFDQQKGSREISSFQIDSPRKLLTLSSDSLIPKDAKRDTIIPLVDLRPLGDFVEHYACTVLQLQLDAHIYRAEALQVLDSEFVRPIVAVFDSGLTGCLISQPLWDFLEQKGLKLRNVRSVNVGVSTNELIDKRASTVKVENDKNKACYYFQTEKDLNPFYYISPINLDWFDDEDTCPHVIVLGQTFLSQGSLTIDIDERKANFVKY